jgi:Uma2 family endonuclease
MEALSPDEPEYPDSDGKPLADNTLQFDWIVMLKGNLDALLPDFVGGDLLWYPVRGDARTRAAPDVMVALGRPKGYRGSYKQWEEDGLAPQVVFEVLSPGNTPEEMADKLDFYEKHGVEEYYVVDPDLPTLEVYLRKRGQLRLAVVGEEHTSKRLGIRFVRKDGVLSVFHPDGTPFLDFLELRAERDTVAAERDTVAAERDAVAAERDAVAAERDAAAAKAARLAERLRALGLDPDEL